VYEIVMQDWKKKFDFFFGEGKNTAKTFFNSGMTFYTPIDSPCRAFSKYAVFKIF
jgi:hypothetical protein